MVDIVSPTKRSAMMANIRAKGTKPERLLVRELRRRGIVVRCNVRNLPGVPDLVVASARCAIFVHGCFWHCHGCKHFKWPATRPDFWRSKILQNVRRDRRAVSKLRRLGWRTKVVWECQLCGQRPAKQTPILDRLVRWLRRGTADCEAQ